MKRYGFYSESQARAGGTALFKTPNGSLVKVSETTITGRPAGFWADYKYYGEVVECVESNISVPAFNNFPEEIKTDKKKVIQIDFLDYLDAPELLVTDLSFVLSDSDKVATLQAILEGYVSLHLFTNKVSLSQLFIVLQKVGYTQKQIANEIVAQKKSQAAPHSVN